jgi:hypothetical protein
VRLTGPAGLVEGSEAAWVATNDAALYGLAAIENLALLGDRMPARSAPGERRRTGGGARTPV